MKSTTEFTFRKTALAAAVTLALSAGACADVNDTEGAAARNAEGMNDPISESATSTGAIDETGALDPDLNPSNTDIVDSQPMEERDYDRPGYDVNTGDPVLTEESIEIDDEAYEPGSIAGDLDEEQRYNDDATTKSMPGGYGDDSQSTETGVAGVRDMDDDMGSDASDTDATKEEGAQTDTSTGAVATSGQSAGDSMVGESNQSMAELKENPGNLSVFVTALEDSGLANEVTEQGQDYTAFAPTDEAFEALGERKEELLKPENRKELVSLVRRHLLVGAFDAGRVGQLRSVTNVNGETVALNNHDGAQMVDEAEVVDTGKHVGSLTIHTINKVLGPEGDKMHFDESSE